MKQANIAYTRNNLSKLLAEVREGASVLIMDRQQPVARLGPVSAIDGHASYRNRLVTGVEAQVEREVIKKCGDIFFLLALAVIL